MIFVYDVFNIVRMESLAYIDIVYKNKEKINKKRRKRGKSKNILTQYPIAG